MRSVRRTIATIGVVLAACQPAGHADEGDTENDTEVGTDPEPEASVGDPADADTGVGGEESSTEGAPDLLPWPSIAYWGVFDWEGVVATDEGYVFDNDLGFTFRIDTFGLAVMSIQLVPCTEHAAGQGAGAAVPLELGLVHEGDAQFSDTAQNDPSIIAVGIAEDVFSASLREFGVGEGGEQVYCDAFWLSAPLLDPDPRLDSDSISITGAYRPPGADGEDDWVPFETAVALSAGTLTSLVPHPDDSSRPTTDDQADVNIIVTRYPARAFDALDPRELSSVELAWEVLRNMLQDSSVSYVQR